MSILFDPTTFGPFTLKNRIVLAPLTRGRAGSSRIPNEIMQTYYTQRAGAGMLIAEATTVCPRGNGWVDSPGIYTKEMMQGWQAITAAVKQAGSHIILQLWHTGRASHSDFHDGKLPFSASAVKLQGDHIHTHQGKKEYETPQAMTLEDIQDTIEAYRTAAHYAKEAGFSGVEIHGANGYLINQFSDKKSNQRDDDYGGSIENRCRFFEDVIKAVLTVWPANQVGARISPNGVFNDMGSDDFRETHLHIAKMLNQYKLGYLHVMDGLGFGFHKLGEPMQVEEFREVFEGLIIGNVGYDKTSAEAAVEANKADLIAFGRPFITNPDLPYRFQHNHALAPWDDMSQWYGGGAEGYLDYPTVTR